MAQATWRKEAWLGEPPHRLTWPNLPPTLKDKPKSKREGLRPQANLGLGGWSLCPQSGRFPIFLPFPASHRKFERTKTQYSLLLLNPTTPQIQPLWLLQTRAWGCAPARAAVGAPLARGSGPRKEAARPHPCCDAPGAFAHDHSKRGRYLVQQVSTWVHAHWVLSQSELPTGAKFSS